MGRQGDRSTDQVGHVADDVVARLAPLGDVWWKKMFGGAGIFCGDRMFGLIDSTGLLHLKVGDTDRERYEQAGAVKHARMPYSRVPESMLTDDEALLEWAGESVEVAR